MSYKWTANKETYSGKDEVEIRRGSNYESKHKFKRCIFFLGKLRSAQSSTDIPAVNYSL